MSVTPRQTIIAVCNEKGGTAKTTTSVTLSAALGELGKQVLLVDLDGQAASSRWMGVENDNRLAEAMSRGGGLEPVMNVTKNVSLAPASGKLDSVAHDLRPTQGGQLRKILGEMTQFDYILIDCPPSLGNRLIGNALLAATHVIVPVETSILALDGLKILLTTLEDVREGFDHDLRLGGVLACRFDGRTRLSRMVVAELRRALPGRVFNTVVREAVRMRECPASGQTIFEFAPECHAAADYLAAAREMIDSPQRWRPAERTPEDIRQDLSMTEEFSMNSLRDRTAAMVCCPSRSDDSPTEDPKDIASPDASQQTPPPAEQAVELEQPIAAAEPTTDCLADPQTPPVEPVTDGSIPLELQIPAQARIEAPAEPPEGNNGADREFAAFLERLTAAEENLKAQGAAVESDSIPGSVGGSGCGVSWDVDVSQQLDANETKDPEPVGALRVRVFNDDIDPAEVLDVHQVQRPATDVPEQLHAARDVAPEPAVEPAAPEAQGDTEALDFQADDNGDPFPALRALHSKLVSEGRIAGRPPEKKPAPDKTEKRRGLWRAWTRK